MNRREFVFGLGGLVAATALPGCVSESSRKLATFAARGKYERLQLGYRHIQAGATRPFSVLHISDTHLTAAYPHEPEVKQTLKACRTQCFGGFQEQALCDSLAWAKENADYVLHTGDLIDWQSEANFDLVRRYFGEIPLGAVGNHEYSPSMWLTGEAETGDDAWRAKSAAALAATYPFDVSFHAQTVNGVNFVMIDDVFGTVSAQQVERFAAEAKKGLPIVLCMHVPFGTDHIRLANDKFWFAWGAKGKKFTTAALDEPKGDWKRQLEDPVTRDFVKYLRSEKLLKGILAGHLHFDVQDRFSPTAMEYVVGGNFLFHGQEILFT